MFPSLCDRIALTRSGGPAVTKSALQIPQGQRLRVGDEPPRELFRPRKKLHSEEMELLEISPGCLGGEDEAAGNLTAVLSTATEKAPLLLRGE